MNMTTRVQSNDDEGVIIVNIKAEETVVKAAMKKKTL